MPIASLQPPTQPVSPYGDQGIENPPQYPVINPTASDVARTGTLPAGGVEAVQAATAASETNRFAQERIMNERKAAYLELVKRGKVAAKLAYDGAPEVFNDPNVTQFLPDPSSPSFIDPETGGFSFVEWSKAFENGRKEWLKYKLDSEKQQAITARADKRLQMDQTKAEALKSIQEASLALKKVQVMSQAALTDRSIATNLTSEMNDLVKTLEAARAKYIAQREAEDKKKEQENEFKEQMGGAADPFVPFDAKTDDQVDRLDMAISAARTNANFMFKKAKGSGGGIDVPPIVPDQNTKTPPPAPVTTPTATKGRFEMRNGVKVYIPAGK